MKTLARLLTFALAALVAPLAPAAVVNFHFGAMTQTGGAALGGAGDRWNSGYLTNGTLVLQDSAGAATPITVTWTSSEVGVATGTLWSSRAGTPMDAATTPLMIGYAESNAATPSTVSNLSVTLTGLQAGRTYTIALYGAGDLVGQGTIFKLVGASTTWGGTLAVTRMLSSGSVNAYCVCSFQASSTGTLKITCYGGCGGLPHAVMNGFQLALGTVTPNNTVPAATAAPIKIWGVTGHPGLPDYASYLPANVATQMKDIRGLGASYYRCALEGTGPSYLDYLAPQAKAAGVTLLVNIPLNLVSTNSGQMNYNNNYSIGYNWASYAISKGYAINYWELGNEPENIGLVKVVGDGAAPNQFPDLKPGGFVAIATGLLGAYDGVKQAYTDGRASGKTAITPQCMTGMCFHHWGLLAKIQNYDGELPCDIISWHWYGPLYGDFNAPANAPGQPDNGRSPEQCLADFRNKTDPTKPMDVWITEADRTTSINGVIYNGSVTNNTTPRLNQDYTAQATALTTLCESFKKAPTVKAVFAYELYDEPLQFQSNPFGLASLGYLGLVTGLNGTKKAAYTAFQTEITSAK